MRYWIYCLSFSLSAVFGSCGDKEQPQGGVWSSVPPVVEGETDDGYGCGVSAPFIGEWSGADGEIVVAGGCNFPEVPAAQGGAKRFYDNVFVFDTATYAWHAAGRLPQPLAYGASGSMPEGVICAGGSDSAGRAVREAFLLTADGVRTLAPLPEPMDNCAGAVLDGRFYVAGDTTFCIYDPATDVWRKGPLWRTGDRRVQPVLVAQGGRVWFFGGYDPAGPEFVHRGGYAYDPTTDAWEAVAGPTDPDGAPLLTAGGIGVAWGEDSILSFGGVNTAIFTEALRRGRALAAAPENDSLRRVQREYMEQEPAWYRFNDRVAVFNTTTRRWSLSDVVASESARAGAGAAVLRGAGVLLFNGELKPGIRTPEVWLLRLDR